MNICIDISPLKNANSARGVGFYTQRLISSLKEFLPEHNYQLLENPGGSAAIKADLIHYPYFDLFFLTLPIRTNTPIIVTVHDVIPLMFPKLFPKGVRGWIKLQIQKFKLHLVDAIITDSYSSKRDIAKYLGIPKKKIHVVHLAVDEFYEPNNDSSLRERIKQKYQLPGSFLIKVGDISPTKNFEVTLRALAVTSDINLVLVGKALVADKDRQDVIPELKKILRMISELGLENRVHRLGFVPNDEMAALYSMARATLQNSLYEGFGLPALESLSCGTPVISSNVGSLPEVTGETGIVINPYSVDETAGAMRKIFEMDQEGYESLQKACLQQAKGFSMNKMAIDTYNIYAAINQKNKSLKK